MKFLQSKDQDNGFTEVKPEFVKPEVKAPKPQPEMTQVKVGYFEQGMPKPLDSMECYGTTANGGGVVFKTQHVPKFNPKSTKYTMFEKVEFTILVYTV